MSNGGQPKYVLGQRIAQGGMAEIYLGKIVGAEGFTRICAFKKILPHFAEDEEFVDMFRNEAMVAKQLQNKNIVQVFDFDATHSSAAMLVMEYVEGENLKTVMIAAEKQKVRIPIEIACFIVAESLSGLYYAHTACDISGKSLGIIHRDVSPQNILVSFEGDVKITDFGIAKAGSGNMTRAGVLKGKFRYMSPEQAGGLPLDGRSDVFAIGIVLYEMLTMTHLIKGDNDLEILQAARDAKIRSPNSIKGCEIPSELESIVMRLLAKDVKARYANAKDAGRDLMRFLYSFRKDFYPSELADFMQKLFAERMITTRERMRSTLALPVESLKPAGPFSSVSGVSVAKLVGQGVPNELALPGEGLSSEERRRLREKNAFKGPPGGTQIEMDPNEKPANLEILNQGPADATRGGTRPGTQNMRRNGTHAKQAAPVVKKKKLIIPWERILLLVGVVAVVFVLGLFMALKAKLLTFSSRVELRASVSSQKRVRIRLNGRAINEGAWVDLPVFFNLDAGKHTVSVSKPGYKDFEASFTNPLLGSLAGGNRVETVFLGKEASLGAVLVFTDPENAKISLDEGQFLGRSGQQLDFVPVGRHYKLVIEHPKCSRMVTEIEIPGSAAGELFTKQYTLRNCK